MKKNEFAALLLTTVTAVSLLGCSSAAKPADTAKTAETTTAAEATAAQENGSGSAETADGFYTIGIAQFAVHGSLDNCREGFLQGLAEEGIEEGKNRSEEHTSVVTLLISCCKVRRSAPASAA